MPLKTSELLTVGCVSEAKVVRTGTALDADTLCSAGSAVIVALDGAMVLDGSASTSDCEVVLFSLRSLSLEELAEITVEVDSCESTMLAAVVDGMPFKILDASASCKVEPTLVC